MRRVCVLLLLMAAGISVVACSSQAADLQEGWYAKIGGVTAYQYTWDPYGGSVVPIFSAQFSTSPGEYAPFTVTDGPSHTGWRRDIYVTQTVLGVGADQNLVLPIDLGLLAGINVDNVTISCETNYDPTQMWLGLWHRRLDGNTDLLWSQRQHAGQWLAGGSILFSTTIQPGDYYFQVSVVPEPSSFAATVALCGAVGILPKRRRQA